MGVRRGIDRKKVGCRSLIDAYLEGQVGVNKFKLYKGSRGRREQTWAVMHKPDIREMAKMVLNNFLLPLILD